MIIKQIALRIIALAATSQANLLPGIRENQICESLTNIIDLAQAIVKATKSIKTRKELKK